MLSAEKIGLAFGSNVVLDDVSLELGAHSLTVLIGPNGAGKSSILRCLFGWQQPHSGGVFCNSKDIQQLSSIERAALLGWLPQRPSLSEGIPVVEWVAAARYRFDEGSSLRLAKATEFINRSGLSELRLRRWDTLSGGECQRVALTALRTQEAQCWLLDEPANHLDPAVQTAIYEELMDIWRLGTTMLLVTHNLNLLLGSLLPSELAHVQVVALADGRVAWKCSLDDSTLAERVGSLYGLESERITAFGQPQLVFGKVRR